MMELAMKMNTAASRRGSHKAARSVMSNSPGSGYRMARILQRVFAAVLLGMLAIQVHAADDLDKQRALIDSTLSKFVLEPAPPGRVFFLGFAGYGEERVFAEEIKLASERIADRFG